MAEPAIELDSTLEARISESVSRNLENQLEFIQALVRHPSVRGQEHTAQDFLFRQMKKRGLTMDRWQVDVDDIKSHPGYSPVTVDYSNAPIGPVKKRESP